MTTMAGYYINHQQMEKAEQYLIRVLDKRPRFFPARMLNGEIAIHKKDFIGAIGVFDQLLSEEPRSYKAHYLKGLAHLGKGESQVAKASLSKAIELNGKFAKAKILLAEIAMKERDFEYAQRLCTDILKG